MRLHDGGACYAVSVSRAEVDAFKRRWPCSGLPDRAVTFHFDRRNGDLVDITPARVAHLFDGPAALALSHDAHAYGQARLGEGGAR